MNTTSDHPRKKAGIGRLLLIVASLLAVAVALYFVYMVALAPGATDFAGGRHVPMSSYPGRNPSGVPAELENASLVERGEYLTRAADCAACHTAEGGEPFAGGRAFVLPFGTLYSTNITPDRDTGIGADSDTDFRNALRKGIGRHGQRLYPAMPFASYTYMTDADAAAIQAYLFSLKPVSARAPASTLKFPYDQRWLMGIWAALFNPDKRFEPRPERSPEWNRGAYLAEAMAHCGDCHTPRNLMQALDNRDKFAGTVQAGWRAYNITADASSGVGAWSETDLAHYLMLGHADGRGTAAGPMGEAVDLSLRHLTPGDIGALVAYLRTVPSISSPDLPVPKAQPAPATYAQGDADTSHARGKAIYAGACAGCHDWSGVSPGVPAATLTGSRAVNDPSATNVAQVILTGAHRQSVGAGDAMPAFGATYSDAEVASLANYVTARFGAEPSALTAQKIAELRAQD
jgi:mono/diheme cytochrome c family protein